jgi:serine/threonine protein kinase
MVSEESLAGDDELPDGFAAIGRLADYHLEERIGAGGMAVVFRARDERLQRHVALKVLAPALAGDDAFRQRFIRESQAAAAVDDPHIIPVFEAGEAEGVLFLAMRYVPGGDVRTLVRRTGPLSPMHALSVISPVASALDAAHSAGLVHRDVKLANILLDAHPGRPDHVYLSDFGLSKMVMSSLGPTQAGQFLGTPGYSAPEQLEGKPVDGRADQYSLACAAFELLCGQTPFPRDQLAAVIYAHIMNPPPALTSRRPDLPPAVDDVLSKALAKAPSDRYASCRAFADALRNALDLAPYNSESGVSPQAVDTSAESANAEHSGSAHHSSPAPEAVTENIASHNVQEAAESGTVPEAAVSGHEEQHESRLAQASRPGRPPTPTSTPSRGSADAARTVGPYLRPGGNHRSPPARRPGRRPWLFVATVLVVLLAAVMGGGYAAWRWSQNQYYVGADSKGQEVLIYRGVNQHIVGISLSHRFQGTGIKLTQVPPSYQQTVKATDAASNLSGAQAIVANIRSAVATCQAGYTALRQWVIKDNAYQAALARARKQHKPAKDIAKDIKAIPGPGQQPTRPPMCQPSTAFGIAPDALVPSPGAS